MYPDKAHHSIASLYVSIYNSKKEEESKVHDDWYNDFLKECEGISMNEVCPHCGHKALVRIADLDYVFTCSACGHTFEFDGRYADELDYMIARKQ